MKRRTEKETMLVLCTVPYIVHIIWCLCLRWLCVSSQFYEDTPPDKIKVGWNVQAREYILLLLSDGVHIISRTRSFNSCHSICPANENISDTSIMRNIHCTLPNALDVPHRREKSSSGESFIRFVVLVVSSHSCWWYCCCCCCFFIIIVFCFIFVFLLLFSCCSDIVGCRRFSVIPALHFSDMCTYNDDRYGKIWKDSRIKNIFIWLAELYVIRAIKLRFGLSTQYAVFSILWTIALMWCTVSTTHERMSNV